jgi:hypothetical protein
MQAITVHWLKHLQHMQALNQLKPRYQKNAVIIFAIFLVFIFIMNNFCLKNSFIDQCKNAANGKEYQVGQRIPSVDAEEDDLIAGADIVFFSFGCGKDSLVDYSKFANVVKSGQFFENNS